MCSSDLFVWDVFVEEIPRSLSSGKVLRQYPLGILLRFKSLWCWIRGSLVDLWSGCLGFGVWYVRACVFFGGF